VNTASKMNRRWFLKKAFAGSAVLAAGPCLKNPLFAGTTELPKKKRPNVIVIMCDDLGWGDLSCYPQERDRKGVALDTPNIDRLAKMGIRCTNGYATAPVCAPSRAGFKMGRYQQTVGYYEFYETLAGIPRKITTIGEMFKQNGYATAFIGKWHSSDTFEIDNPGRRGFDEWYSFVAQHDYYDPRNGQPILAIPHSYDCYMHENGVPDKSDSMEYLTDIFTDKAVDFVDRKCTESKPFFLYLPYNAPHPPLQTKWEKLKKYYPDFGKKKFTSRDLVRAMIDSVDEGIARILDELKKHDQLDNTLIFFSSDNGGHDDGRNGPPHGLVQHNGGLRGRKGYLWEGGIRVPFIVTWPVRLSAGKVYSNPVNHLDIFATAAIAAQCSGVPENLDGVNLLPYLDGSEAGTPHEVLYWGFSGDTNRWAVRKGDWKLICEMPSPVTTQIDSNIRMTGLYNLKDDIHEENNLIEQHPEKATELLKLKRDFYNRCKPTIVTAEQDKKWRDDYKYRKENPDGAVRRDGYPGCWK
jgi:arylsulfatase A-like enzyme